MSQLPGHAPDDLAFQNGDRGLFLAGSRALAYSHVAVDMLRKQLLHQVGEDLARAIVAQAGRQAGFNDAQLQLQERQFDGIRAMTEMQYHLLAKSGFGRFEVMQLEVARESGEAYVRVRCTGSAEAESHRRLFGASTLPTCWHLTGYSTGWLSAMTNMRLLTIESRCTAKGDAHCEMESLTYDDFVGPEAAFWKRAFESSGTSLAQELEDKLATIQRQMAMITAQQSTIQELSTPILEVWDDVLVMPVIGMLDSSRVADMVQRLLAEVASSQASFVIVDLTGVEVVDTKTADHVMRLMRKVEIIGARCVLTGIRSAVSQTLVDIGVDFGRVTTLRNLKHGLREALRHKRGQRAFGGGIEVDDDLGPEPTQPRKLARS
jgi:rsbT co-antagonist protein RsbR